MWLSGLSAGLRTKGSPVWFPVRAHAWVVGQVPSREQARGNHTLMFLFLSFSLPSPLSKKINKIFLKNKVKCEIRKEEIIYNVNKYSLYSSLNCYTILKDHCFISLSVTIYSKCKQIYDLRYQPWPTHRPHRSHGEIEEGWVQCLDMILFIPTFQPWLLPSYGSFYAHTGAWGGWGLASPLHGRGMERLTYQEGCP